jgi:hypothetical protein
MGSSRRWLGRSSTASLTAGLAGVDLPPPEQALRDLRRRPRGRRCLKALFEAVAGLRALRAVAAGGPNFLKIPGTSRTTAGPGGRRRAVWGERG